MNTPITLRYTLEPDMVAEASLALSGTLARRAQGRRLWSALRHVGLWVLIFFVLTVGLDFFGFAPDRMVVFGAVGGAGLGVFVSSLQVQGIAFRMVERVGRQIASEGEWQMEITPERITERSDTSLRRISMAIVDEVFAVQGGSVILSHGFGFILPDTALPERLSPEDFRAQVTRWADAARGDA